MFKEKCSQIPITIIGNEKLLIKDPEEEKRIQEEKDLRIGMIINKLQNS